MKREIWVDFLRVTACFMVMVVHGTEPFYIGADGANILTATDAFVVVGLAAVLLQRLPRVGKWLVG